MNLTPYRFSLNLDAATYQKRGGIKLTWAFGWGEVIKIQFWMLTAFYLENEKGNLKSFRRQNKENCIRNMKKNNSRKKSCKIYALYTKTENNLWYLGDWFNEHSYQVGFQSAQRFWRRRMKCQSLRTLWLTQSDDNSSHRPLVLLS